MVKNSAIYVALDLETTGLHQDDAILEVAAVKFRGSEIVDTFESFVAPGRSIPYRVQRLTGIKAEHLVGAPVFSSLAYPLQKFLGDFPIVGHSIPFDVGFLQRRGLARTNPLIDTFELATVLLPSLSSYNLGHVAESLGVVVPPDRHRAMVDTVLAMEVFLALHRRLEAVDLAMLNDLAHLDAPRNWPLLNFFRQEVRERQDREGLRTGLARGSLGDRFASQLGMDPRILSFAVTKQIPVTDLEQQNAPTPADQLDLAVIAEHALAQPQVPTFIADSAETAQRYQGARDAVRASLETQTPLLMEVTVGGHDYTPVLLPTLEWLTESVADQTSPRRLIIACTNQHSARQLMEETLPLLQTRLNSTLPVAYLAERGGYLCTHRWFGAALRRTSGELTAEQARGMAKLGLWAQQTLHGERGELTLLPQEANAWDRLSSGVERLPSADSRAGTIYSRCTYRRKGYCFVSLAEERVNAARIVVTTFGGLFDDLSNQNSLLAGIPQRLILDADLLEEENARWSNTELDQARLLRTLNTIGVELENGRYQGLLALAAPALRENGPGGLSSLPTVTKADLDARMLNWFQALRHARAAAEKLFGCFGAALEEFVQHGNGRDKGRKDATGRSQGGRNSEQRIDQPLRLNNQIRQVAAWGDVEDAWQKASQRLQAVIDLASAAEKMIVGAQRGRKRLDSGSGEDTSVASEFSAVAYQLQEQKQLIQQAMSLADSEYVYWLRMPPTPPSVAQRNNNGEQPATPLPEITPVLYRQLVQVSTLMQRLLLKEHTSTILAGTALSVDNAFSFIRGRFGFEDETTPTCSLVTDHHDQTLLYVPDDVPEPNAPQYQRHLDETLAQLATTLNGQLVGLFTSHAALRSSYMTIKPLLESRGILVLGQGVDGSPRQLWQVFQSQERVVLLGTGSFWDGIEEISRPPTCVFVARLPMPVLNDPPIAARADQYSDQLHQLTVPIAALRMRRALNRLVWSSTQRNAIVIFDRRVVSKEYGSIVLHSLPRMSQRQDSASHASETILDWLATTSSTDTDAQKDF